ncbi:MAG TPA: sulfatase-like hydrolase/transferase [Steroidobacteraceae bacterium]|nr:sulfatase-like hydrolase/transferase [Steroidobacteraceae bacterium]
MNLRHGLLTAAAVLLLNVLLTLQIIWPTPWVTWHGSLSVELGVLLVALGAFAFVAPKQLPRLAIPLAILLLLLVFGRYGVVASYALYGRPINLYWDAPHVGNVVAMFATAAPVWQLVLAVIAVLSLFGILGSILLCTLRVLLRAEALSRARAVLMIVGVLLIAGFAADWSNVSIPFVDFAQPVTTTYLEQVQRIRKSAASSGAVRALPPSPPLPANLKRLRGADVVVVFVESYGASTYDMPRYRDALRDARNELAAAVASSGRQIRSAFVRSPTISGGSWLAHVSLVSGVALADPNDYALLMTQKRETMVDAFRRAGYRCVALMPGLRQEWPEGAFYRFDAIHNARAINWQGPEFGWWRIPDQFTLARLLDMELTTTPRQPVFAVIATISTHLPFEPVPPLQPDWQQLRSSEPYAADVLARSLARKPEWLDLGRSYIDAVDYSLRSLSGLLRERPDSSSVFVIIGDHQPASNVSGDGASWDVPVHVFIGNSDVLAALVAAGFAPGIEPPRATLAPMHELQSVLLHAFEKKAAD